jgi:hypothetical protein
LLKLEHLYIKLYLIKTNTINHNHSRIVSPVPLVYWFQRIIRFQEYHIYTPFWFLLTCLVRKTSSQMSSPQKPVSSLMQIMSWQK